MKLNLELIPNTPASAADKLTPQAAQYLGQLMQLFGVATVEYKTYSKAFTPADVQVTPFQQCPEPIQAVAWSVAFWLCGLMHEMGLSKLSYEYTQSDVATLKPLWDKASEGIRKSELLVAPDVTPDMERIEIDL